ncbi:helix-turn-helix domain-containing protein [Galbibacter sp. PAP.153]|uniref:helix-turn-helix domain-containing protein n=1 Tax=Galbibacter sp. PAP.153 TaxID=3104623 RepID=UPI00300852EA
MKIGSNIKEIREVEKNYKRSYVAQKLNITTRAYANIENDITGLTVNRLQEIASILDCSISYILNYKQSKKEFYNHFHNYNGNKGVNILNQGVNFSNFSLQKLQEELLQSQRERIALLETLLKQNNINISNIQT